VNHSLPLCQLGGFCRVFLPSPVEPVLVFIPQNLTHVSTTEPLFLISIDLYLDLLALKSPQIAALLLALSDCHGFFIYYKLI